MYQSPAESHYIDFKTSIERFPFNKLLEYVEIFIFFWVNVDTIKMSQLTIPPPFVNYLSLSLEHILTNTFFNLKKNPNFVKN